MVGFGIGNTLIWFREKSYQYGSIVDKDGQELTIGGYESAWLADLVAAIILENTQPLFSDTIFNEIYRDDELTIFTGKKTKADIVEWLFKFQKEVNKLCKTDILQLTVEIWLKKNDEAIESERVTIRAKDCLPYLDMELFWNDDDELNFRSTWRKIKPSSI